MAHGLELEIWHRSMGTHASRQLRNTLNTGGLVGDPQSVSMRGRHFKREIKTISKWTATRAFRHFSVADDADWGTFKHSLREVFLFMMNNYIIEPSSAYYAEALGSSDALSGLMIGMAPWFALSSSVGYSCWTASEEQRACRFFWFLRYRNIGTRYVADASPFSLRTAASAAFVMATARYFMALCWFVYTLCIAFFFGEPTRSGLEELRQREEAATTADSENASLLDEVSGTRGAMASNP